MLKKHTLVPRCLQRSSRQHSVCAAAGEQRAENERRATAERRERDAAAFVRARQQTMQVRLDSRGHVYAASMNSWYWKYREHCLPPCFSRLLTAR